MTTPERVETIAVIGNGLMGHGIAQVFAVAGRAVCMIGRQDESLAIALQKIDANLAEFVSHGLISRTDAADARGRISTSTDINDAGSAQFVIEAVPAIREVQQEIFEKLDALCPPPTILGSTSGQPISLMVDRMQHPERAIAVHFIYPAPLIPVVEVCAGPATDADVVPWVCDVLAAAGKTATVVDREVDGFIVNRIQFAMLREAWSMWANGIASAEAIDTTVRLSLGRRMSITGPIESAEVGGLDTLHGFGEFLFPTLDTAKAPPKEVGDLVKDGHRGLPSGKGIYDWSKRDGEALLKSRMEQLFRHLAND